MSGQEALVPAGSGHRTLRCANTTAAHSRMKLFEDRVDAGRQLAQRLEPFAVRTSSSLGLPRGGVPVAFEVAKALAVPLDVLVVRKLGVPFQPELAFGAIGEGGVRVINDAVVRARGPRRRRHGRGRSASSGSSCNAAWNASAAGVTGSRWRGGSP